MCLSVDIGWSGRTSYQKLAGAKQKASNSSFKISCNSYRHPTRSENFFTVLTTSGHKKTSPKPTNQTKLVIFFQKINMETFTSQIYAAH